MLKRRPRDYTVRFHVKYYGDKFVSVRAFPGDTAQDIAFRAMRSALGTFGHDWPGVRMRDLVARSISNGVRAVA